MIRPGQASVAGAAAGRALVLTEPLSFWGDVDVATGRIIDHSHPALGSCVTGMILVMPGGRGSSSSSSVLAEAIRRGTAPAALLLGRPDPILTVGALVARSLYGVTCPIIGGDVAGFMSGDEVRIAMPHDERAALSGNPIAKDWTTHPVERRLVGAVLAVCDENRNYAAKMGISSVTRGWSKV